MRELPTKETRMATKAQHIKHIDFVKHVKTAMGGTTAQAEAAIKAVTEAIVFTAGQGTLNLRAFGTFKTTLSKSRVGRNPATGESVDIPAREKLSFKMSPMLRKD